MLEVTRERIYGGMAYRGSKHVYRARVGNEDVATGETRTQAIENAWSKVEDALRIRWVTPEIGRTTDGDTCVGIQTGAREYCLYWFNADTSARGGCETGRLELNGSPCSLAQYVQYSVFMRNGVDYHDAARLAVAA